MEKTFLVYCRHVSFVTKGGVWCYSLSLRRREEFWGGGVTQKLEGKIGGVMQKISLIFEKPPPPAPPPPPLPVKNEWSLERLTDQPWETCGGTMEDNSN